MQALKGVRYFTTSTVKQAVSELSVPVPWGEVRGKVWGPENGRPVLCLHGWADNCGTFNKLIPLLPKGDKSENVYYVSSSKDGRGVNIRDCRYVAVDMPGHGLSSHRPPGVFYSFPLYVADVCRVVDALRWERFSIIGHSMGGNVAGMYSALYPEMVNAVVLLDSYGFFPTASKEVTKIIRQGIDEHLQFEKKNEEKKEKVYTYEEAVKRLLDANPSLSEESVKILLERGLVQTDGGFIFSRDFRINLTLDDLFLYWMFKQSCKTPTKNIVRLSMEQSLELQSKIQADVLVVLAEDGFEKLFAKGERKKFTSALLQGYKDQNHKVVQVPGNHHVHLNNPETVAPLVTDFLLSNVRMLKETPKL